MTSGDRVTHLGGATTIAIPGHRDERGLLAAIDFDALPFTPLRAFTVSDVPPGTTRGGHAHRDETQVLVCIAGEVAVTVRDESGEREVTLDDPTVGLVVPPGVWSSQTYLRDGTVLLVLASEPFDPDSYT